MQVERPPDIIRELLGLDSRLRFSEILTGGRRWGPLEPWHNIGAAGEPGFQNGWQDFGDLAHNNPVGYFRDQRGQLHIRGNVAKPGGPPPVASIETIFNVPVGLRPPATVGWITYCQYTDSGGSVIDTVCEVYCLTNGDYVIGTLYQFGGTGTVGHVDLMFLDNSRWAII